MRNFRCITIGVALAASLSLSACYSQHTQLSRADGKRAYCNADGMGAFGALYASQKHDECIMKYESMGFHKQ